MAYSKILNIYIVIGDRGGRSCANISNRFSAAFVLVVLRIVMKSLTSYTLKLYLHINKFLSFGYLTRRINVGHYQGVSRQVSQFGVSTFFMRCPNFLDRWSFPIKKLLNSLSHYSYLFFFAHQMYSGYPQ